MDCEERSSLKTARLKGRLTSSRRVSGVEERSMAKGSMGESLRSLSLSEALSLGEAERIDQDCCEMS